MKKSFYVVGLSLLMMVSGCGNEEAQETPESSGSDTPEVQEAESVETPAAEIEEETDSAEPVEEEIAAQETIEFPEGAMDLVSYFGTEESYEREINSDEGGSIPIDFDGFKVNTTFYLVDFRPNEEYLYEFEEKETVRAIMAITETENTNEYDVDYNGGMTVITDTKEQVSAASGLMGSNPVIGTYYGQVEEEGYYIIPLKDDSKPEKITVIMDGPWRIVDGAVNTETGQMGEEQRFELQAYYE